MKRFYRLASLLLSGLLYCLPSVQAADGDTIRVQTIGFSGPQEGTYLFPGNGVRYQKVLMNYTIKCPCGEWDYLKYVYLERKNPADPGKTERYELMRFITPYGNGMPNNFTFTWTMDVTDFAPLLRDSVRLVAENGQQPISITFDIITGIPARDVLSIKPLWSGHFPYGYEPSIESNLSEQKVFVSPETKNARLRILQTGHGFGAQPENCAEFCPKFHYIKVDGQQRYQTRVWRENCGLNPVYPQGGTWVYARTNWCPGAEVQPYSYELSPYIKAGDSLALDVDMEAYKFPENGGGTQPYYAFSAYFVSYGAPNFAREAELIQIKAPTTDQTFKRTNPVCGNPVVVVRNNGTEPITSLKFSYGIQGETPLEYTWSGSLSFLEEKEITLPVLSAQNFAGEKTFEVKISEPNGQADEYASNNMLSSKIVLPPLYYKELEVNLRTNKAAAEQYEWTLKNIGTGQIIASKSNLLDETKYLEPFVLEDGCYEFRFVNKLHYGLSWWATQAQLGNGSLSLLSLGKTVKTFPGDFGTEIYHQFRVGPKPTVKTNVDTLDFGIIDSAASRDIMIEISSGSSIPVEIRQVSLNSKKRGFTILSMTPDPTDGAKILQPGEKMQVMVRFTAPDSKQQVTLLNVVSNDERFPTKAIRLVGNAEPVSVEEFFTDRAECSLSAQPNIFGDETAVSFSANTVQPVQGKIFLTDYLGRQLELVYQGPVAAETKQIHFSGRQFPSGTYFLVMELAGTRASIPLVILH